MGDLSGDQLTLPDIDAELAAPPAPGKAPAAPPAPPPETAPGQRLHWLRWAVPAASALFLAVGGWWLWTQMQAPPPVVALPPPPPVAPEPEPEPPPEPQLPEALMAASEALDDGDLETARKLLGEFKVEQEQELDPVFCGFLDGLRRAVADARQDRLGEDLARGLRRADFDLLRKAVRSASAQDKTRLRSQLRRAQAALDAFDALWREHKDRNHFGILRKAAELLQLVPSYSAAAELREQSAVTLETEAADLIRQGRYQEATYRIDALRQEWPDRPGLDRLAGSMGNQQAEDSSLQTVLNQAAATADRRPTDGLAILARARPSARWQGQFQQLQQQLQARFAELDAKAPEIRLVTSGELVYEKDEPLTLLLNISDDYELKAAQFLARLEGGGAFQALPMKPNSGGGANFKVLVPPNFHQNETVEFYVVAEDLSGHTARLASPEAPQLIKKRGFWQRRRKDG